MKKQGNSQLQEAQTVGKETTEALYYKAKLSYDYRYSATHINRFHLIQPKIAM